MELDRHLDRARAFASIRTPGNQRCYTRDVIRRVSFIRAAQRVGLSLEEIRAVLDDLPEGRAPTREDWDRLARRWTPWLDERIAALERLRDKLSSCIGCGCLSLATCALYNPDDAAGRLGPGPRYLLEESPRATSPVVGIHPDADDVADGGPATG